MFQVSIIRHSGQMWKLHVATLALAVSGIGMVTSKIQINSISPIQFAGTMIGSVVVGLAALVFACSSVRCPRCGARWVWMAVSGEGHEAWVRWLSNLRRCPQCAEGAYLNRE